MTPAARYEVDVRQLLLSRVRLGGCLAAVLVPAGWVIDWVVYPEWVSFFLGMRLLFAAGALALVGLTYLPSAASFARVSSVALVWWVSAGVEVLIYNTGASRSAYYPGLMVVIVAAGLLFPWGVKEMLVACLGIIGLYALPALGQTTTFDFPSFFAAVYFLVNGSLVAVVASYFGARLRRREFDARTALEGFFANASHELRTPLSVIMSALELVREKSWSELPARVQVNLTAAQSNAARLLELLNDVLDLARLDAGKVQLAVVPIDLDAFLQGLLRQHTPVADRKAIRLQLECGSCSPIVADPDKLETIVRNLLSNALKFTPNGGQVRVRVVEGAEEVRLEVEDDGEGISPEDLPRVFERFTTTASAHGLRGTGIGLALVKELTVMHGGVVEVESQRGAGALFRVRLPRQVQSEGAAKG
ncbi:MAG: sensor histidine kinase [Myxococcota bacterium]